jgi:hypothetical protein
MIKFHENPSCGGPSSFILMHMDREADGRTNMAKHKEAVRDSANASNKTLHSALYQDQFKNFMDTARNKFADPTNA